jgi:4-amino-4-deoxy-L-arabinose transferase-like glycosyltransferase
MLLTCWITIGILAAERGLVAARRGWLVVAAIAAALGMLTKGVVAPLFVFGVPAVHAWLGGARRPAVRDVVIAAAVFAAVAAPWYVAVELADPGYLREFFLRHHVARFTSDGTSFHPGPWWYYAPALALLFFPWSFLLPAAVVATVRSRDPGLRYCLAWATVVVVFFSCSGGKLATYVLPALPPLAIVMAYGIHALAPAATRGRRVALAGLAVLVVALLTAAPAAYHIERPPWDELVAAGTGYLLLFPAAATVVLVAWRWRGFTAATNAVAAAAAASVLVFYAGAAPLVSQVTSARRIADVITAHVDAPIVSYGVTPASLMFYVGRPVVRLDRPRALRRLLDEQPFAWIVTSPRHVDAIARAVPVYPWVTSGRRVLYATAPASTVASLRTGGLAD